MFRNQIVYSSNNRPVIGKGIVEVAQYILYYGFDNIQNNIKKVEFNKTDKYGPYFEFDAGFYGVKNPQPFIDKYGEENIRWTKDGRLRGYKLRPHHPYSDKPIDNIWTNFNTVGEYPTQKPYKLLERIICLSTL